MRFRLAVAIGLGGLAASVMLAAGCAATDMPGSPGVDGGSDGKSEDAAPNPNGVRLPFAVDDYFVPGGYMGDGEVGGIERFDECAAPRPGEARGLCHSFEWTPGTVGWGGVFWQFPDGSWGEIPGLSIAAGADEVTFYAWGTSGGEKITFVVGMGDVDGFHAEIADVVLTTTPTQYSISLAGTSYTDVTGGFGWVASESAGVTTRFYLDDVQWR